jgi:hypothetical protein
MDRLQQIASEIIRLYRQQLNLWTLGKITTLKDALICSSTTADGIALSFCGES